MSNREHELIQELRAARLREAEAKAAEAAARSVWLERKADTAEAARLVEEILQEVQNGTTGRPLIDYAETADERQRGPTDARSSMSEKAASREAPKTAKPLRETAGGSDGRAESAEKAASMAAKRKREAVDFRYAPDVEPAAPEMAWSDNPILDALAAALGYDGGESTHKTEPWEEFYDLGWIDDGGVEEVLRSIWEGVPTDRFHSGRTSKRSCVKGGPNPAFWSEKGERGVNLKKPDLTGRALCDAVRTIIGLPETEPEPAKPKAKGVKS